MDSRSPPDRPQTSTDAPWYADIRPRPADPGTSGCSRSGQSMVLGEPRIGRAAVRVRPQIGPVPSAAIALVAAIPRAPPFAWAAVSPWAAAGR